MAETRSERRRYSGYVYTPITLVPAQTGYDPQHNMQSAAAIESAKLHIMYNNIHTTKIIQDDVLLNNMEMVKALPPDNLCG